MRENGIYASPTLGFDWESAPRSSLFCFFFFYFIPWPHWGIVWFNSGLALIYICGRIILQLLKIMSAVRRLNQGQRQLPPSMASFHFMDMGLLNGQQFAFFVFTLLFSLVVFSSPCFFVMLKLSGISFILARPTHTHTLLIFAFPQKIPHLSASINSSINQKAHRDTSIPKHTYMLYIGYILDSIYISN